VTTVALLKHRQTKRASTDTPDLRIWDACPRLYRRPAPRRDAATAYGRAAEGVCEPSKRPRIAPAREPPMWEASDDGLAHAVPDWDAPAQPEPEYVLDQQVQW